MDHPSVQLKNPDEEDEFGDFTSAPVNGISSIQEVGIVSGVFFNPMPEVLQEDEFGDFCGPVPIQQPPTLVVGVKPQPNYDIDLDILTPQLPWIAQQQPIDVPPIDEFNAFKSAQPDEIEEEFSQFESAVPHQEIDLLDVAQELSTDEINFPAIGIQPTPVIYAIDLLDAVDSSVVADIPVLSFGPPPTLSEGVAEDDFGEFTTAGPEIISDNCQPEEIEESFTTSFQSLPLNEESVEKGEVSMLDGNHSVKEPIQPQLDDLQSVEETWNAVKPKEEDEFGEFSGQQMDVMVEEEDEFDEFEAAPPVTCPGEANPSETAPIKGMTDEEDEFDDFETAPPATCSSEETNPASTSPETQIQRVLVNLFPLAAETGSVEPGNGCPSPLKAVSIGPLWSYVSQLDSTPALSFSWRHSAANQHFLQQALRLDSTLQPSQAGRWGTGNHAWSTPPSNNSSHHSSSFSDSFSGQQQRGNSFSSNSGDQSSVISPLAQLDLDFFLNPTATPSTSTGGLTADNLLETIERELLSSPPATLKRPVSIQQPPTPSSSSSVQMMSDIFGQLQFAESSGPSTSSATTGIDLLQ